MNSNFTITGTSNHNILNSLQITIHDSRHRRKTCDTGSPVTIHHKSLKGNLESTMTATSLSVNQSAMYQTSADPVKRSEGKSNNSGVKKLSRKSGRQMYQLG